MNFSKKQLKSGQLLLELLIAITVSAIILGLGGNLVYVSLQGNKVSSEKDTALALANETMEAVSAVALERWQSLYTDVTHNSNYYPGRVSDTSRSYKWISHTPPNNSTNWGSAQNVNGVSALSSRNVWIAADNLNTTSNIWQYKGGVWTQRSPVSSSLDFYAVETLSDSEVWVGGASGALWKWDGATWTDWGAASKCNTGSNTIRGISGSSSTNIWIVGASGKVWQVTSASACALIAGSGVPTANLLGVSATSATNVWMVGPSGKVYSYDGSWHEHSGDSGISGAWGGITMNSVSVVSTTNVWVSGTGGNVWNYNGSSWTPHTPDSLTRWGTSSSINGITAFNSTWVAVAGANGEVWEYDGTTWAPHYSGSSVTACETNSLCGSSVSFLGGSNRYSTEWWVVGASGNVWQFQPTKWQLTSGTEAKALGTNTFTRSFIVQNVCRDDTSKNITVVTDTNGTTETCASGSPAGDSWDPSTEKVIVTVSWTGGQTITMSNYVTRWRNSPCLQTQWASTDTGTTAYFCPSTVYNTKTNLDVDTQVVIHPAIITGITGTGTLTSAIFDTTGITSRGSAYNSIMWLGNALTGTQQVQFQIGVYDNDTPGGTLRYNGSDGTCANDGSKWFNPGARSTPIDLKDCASNLNNKRYFVYKMRLCNTNACGILGTGSPTVTDVIINTSP